METAARFVGRFFALALLLVLIGIQNAQCQQAVDLVFTNKFASFTNLQGETFIGAELIEADATQVVFKTNDIYGAVKFTNLSTATLKSLGIPLSRLGLAHELEVQKAKAIANQRDILSQEQEELSDPSKLSGLRINSVISKSYSPIYGWLQWCNVTPNNGVAGTCFIAKLPASVSEYLEQREALSQNISKLNSQIDTATGQISSRAANIKQAQYQNDRNSAASIVISDPGVYATEQANLGMQATDLRAASESLDDAKANVEQWKNQLEDEQKQYQELTRDERAKLSLSVLKSHFQQNYLPILICAPPRVEHSSDSQ